MTKTVFYMLRPACSEVEDINRSDTPRMIISVLPIEHTKLPIASTLIPPFARGVAVLFRVSVQDSRIPILTGILIDGIWSKGIVNDFSKRYATDNHHGVPAT